MPTNLHESNAGTTGSGVVPVKDESDVRLVTLRGGLVVRLDAIELLLDLERRGYRIEREADDVIITPRRGLTPDDLRALRLHKPDALAIISYVEAM